MPSHNCHKVANEKKYILFGKVKVSKYKYMLEPPYIYLYKREKNKKNKKIKTG